MGRSITQWVDLAQNGSKKAFDELIKEYADFIFHFLYDMTGHYEDAKDLTQDVFLRAYKHIHQYRGDAKFSTWLYRIAYNLGIDYCRKRKRIKQVDIVTNENEISQNLSGGRDPESHIGMGEAIEKALQKLTHMQRTSVVLHHYQGFSMREVGDVLGCSESTARVHLFRALRHLRRLLKDYSPGAV